MNIYEISNLWQKFLSYSSQENYKQAIEKLKGAYIKLHDNCAKLSELIRADFPFFTMHGIDHADGLWKISDLLVNEDDLNPLEIFFLGASFLIHDLGMGSQLINKSINDLKLDPNWKDTESWLQRNYPEKTSSEIEKEVLEIILRKHHAMYAKEIAVKAWGYNGEYVYLIEDSDIRNSFGEIIGLIANSHAWNISDLPSRLCGSFTGINVIPSAWTVDPVKIAAILRAADAIHIDNTRAPEILAAVIKAKGISALHWNFQSKLNAPTIERDRLIFTSGRSFEVKDAEAWWLCYDMLKLVDTELRDIDTLLASRGSFRLKAIGVKDIGDPVRIANYIRVSDWIPIDATIKVSNISKLASTLGGEALYGDDYLVPLREMIQNASDAINAKRLLIEDNAYGKITISYGSDKDGEFLEVEDNGVGMSEKVLVGPLLDFSESFWGTPLMHEEFPTLQFKGFASTGKYGIGFFSVFMLGDKVKITTQKYNKGRDDTYVLEFYNGVRSRPILRKAFDFEQLKEAGTKIKVWCRMPLYDLFEPRNITKRPILYSYSNFSELIETLCPTIDCDIDLKEGNIKTTVIKANDWESLPPLDLIKRSIGKNTLDKIDSIDRSTILRISKNLTNIYDDKGKLIGRLCLYPKEKNGSRIRWYRSISECTITVGGLKLCNMDGALGFLKGETNVASRGIAYPVLSTEDLETWVLDQAIKLRSENISVDEELSIAQQLRSIRADTLNFKILEHKSGYLDVNELDDLLNRLNKDFYIILPELYRLNVDKEKIVLNENVFIVDSSISSILRFNSIEFHDKWPKIDKIKKFHDASLDGLLIERIADSWKCAVDDIEKYSLFTNDDNTYCAEIGLLNGKPIKVNHVDLISRKELNSKDFIVSDEHVKGMSCFFKRH